MTEPAYKKSPGLLVTRNTTDPYNASSIANPLFLRRVTHTHTHARLEREVGIKRTYTLRNMHTPNSGLTHLLHDRRQSIL